MLRRAFGFVIAIAVVVIMAMVDARADTPISALPAATPAPADLAIIVHSGTTSNATLAQIFANAQNISFASYMAGANTAVWQSQDGATVPGWVSNVPTGSTNGWRWCVNNLTTCPMQLTASGALTTLGAIAAPSATLTGPLTISSATYGITMPSTPNAYVLSTGAATLHMGRTDLSAAAVNGGVADFYAPSGGTRVAIDTTGDVGLTGSLYAAGGQLFLNSTGTNGPAYIGNDSAGGGLNISIEGVYGVRFWNDLATASAPIAQLDPSGNFYALSFNVSSRRELKDSFAPIADPLAVATSKALAVSTWCYKTEHCKLGQHLHIGPMANDAPVYLSGPKHDHIDQSALNGLTLAAVQQLAAIVEQLRKENAFLRDRIDTLIRENARAVPQIKNLRFDPVKF